MDKDIWQDAVKAADTLHDPLPYTGVHFMLTLPVLGLFRTFQPYLEWLDLSESAQMFLVVLRNNLNALLSGSTFSVLFDDTMATGLSLRFFGEHHFEEGEREQLGLLVREAWLRTSATQDAWLKLKEGVEG